MENKMNADNEKSQIKILVCYYQPWELPKDDIFLPIQAGKDISGFKLLGDGIIQYDNIGDNISDKNETFSEFTAWYWAWKNIKKVYPDIKYIGLSHYRRYFAMEQPYAEEALFYESTIPVMRNYGKLFLDALEDTDIILSKPAYFSCSVKEQYSHWHYESDYKCIKQIVHEIYPDYERSFEYIFENNNGISLYCMFVSKYELFDEYFNWLFPLLFEAEQRIDVSEYSKHQKRVLAFLAERLLNVYVHYHKLRINYRPIYFIQDVRTESKIKKVLKAFIPYGIIKLWENMKKQ